MLGRPRGHGQPMLHVADNALYGIGSISVLRIRSISVLYECRYVLLFLFIRFFSFICNLVLNDAATCPPSVQDRETPLELCHYILSFLFVKFSRFFVIIKGAHVNKNKARTTK